MPTPRTLTRFVIYDLRFAIYDSKIHAARKSYIVNRKSEMKLLVFAHTPPPHHGQSYMVQLMLDGFGGDARRRKAGASGRAAASSATTSTRASRAAWRTSANFRAQKFFSSSGFACRPSGAGSATA